MPRRHLIRLNLHSNVQEKIATLVNNVRLDIIVLVFGQSHPIAIAFLIELAGLRLILNVSVSVSRGPMMSH